MDRPRLSSVLRRAVVPALLALLAVAATASAGFIAPEAGGSPNADRTRTLYWLIFSLGVVVFVGVEGVLIWCIVKFRAKKGRVAAQIHGNTRLEIGWTVGAACLLIFLTVATFVMLPSIKNPAPSEIDANGNPKTVYVNDSGDGTCSKAVPISHFNKSLWKGGKYNVSKNPVAPPTNAPPGSPPKANPPAAAPPPSK